MLPCNKFPYMLYILYKYMKIQAYTTKNKTPSAVFSV